MEIGQSPVDSAYTRPAPEPTERKITQGQESLRSSQPERPDPSAQPTQSGTANGPVGGNIDTYA